MPQTAHRQWLHQQDIRPPRVRSAVPTQPGERTLLDWLTPTPFSELPDAVRDWPGLRPLLACTWGHPLIRIALLASTVDLHHPSLLHAHLDELVPLGLTFPKLAPPTRRPHVDAGSHLARILFGRTEPGVRGLAPVCRGLILPVYAAASNGGLTACRPLRLATAIRQALDHGAQVICVGGCEPALQHTDAQLLEEALQRCAEQNVLVVCPAPLLGETPRRAPALLRVHGLDHLGRPLSADDAGQPAAHTDLLAPGEALLTDTTGGPELYGSSALAAAVVAGIAALLLGLQLQHRRHADPLAVREALLRGALPYGRRQWRLDPGAALARLGLDNPQPVPVRERPRQSS